MRHVSRALMAAGLVGLVIAALWRPIVEPNLVKFPRVDVTLQYAGTLTASVNPLTGEFLATPFKLPLTVDRTVRTVSSGAHRAVVREEVSFHVAGTTQKQTNVYVMDRKSMRNVRDARSTAFFAGGGVDRSGTYFLQFPTGTQGGHSYAVWNGEAGRAFEVQMSAKPVKVHGLSTVEASGGISSAPPSAAYLKVLSAQGFSATTTADALGAQLKARGGLDFAGPVAALLKVLNPTEAVAVTTALRNPIPLQYTVSSGGDAAIEPHTGTVVRLSGTRQQVLVRPDVSRFAALRAILQGHAATPAAQQLGALFAAVANSPAQQILEISYDQTPASVGAMVRVARHRANDLAWARTRAPLMIAAMAGLVLITGATMALRRRGPPAAPGRVVPVPTPAPPAKTMKAKGKAA